MNDARMCLASPAQTLRLDRTKLRICSAAELVPFQALLKRNIEQSSPSATLTADAREVTVPSSPRFAGSRDTILPASGEGEEKERV